MLTGLARLLGIHICRIKLTTLLLDMAKLGFVQIISDTRLNRRESNHVSTTNPVVSNLKFTTEKEEVVKIAVYSIDLLLYSLLLPLLCSLFFLFLLLLQFFLLLRGWADFSLLLWLVRRFRELVILVEIERTQRRHSYSQGNIDDKVSVCALRIGNIFFP